jgi:predicted DNA-binding transcriptional regulator AlpA
MKTVKSTPKATQPENNGYVSDKYLSNRFEVSRATWWRWVREGDAPKPYRFTSQCTRWKLSEVLDWEASQGVSA